MNIYDVLTSGYRWSGHRPYSGAGNKQIREEAAAILEEVGLSRTDLERRPQEFSGGQRQRISIARGLLMQPSLLICDEVVSALDVSIQGQILNLLLDIREKRDLSFLFIAHDLKVACYFCDRIGVMYRGELMEEAPAAELYKQGQHPYTRLLFSSATGIPGNAGNERGPEPAPFGPLDLPPQSAVKPSLAATGSPFSGCAFAERCPLAGERCFEDHPPMREIAGGHRIRCFNI
jgi:oligopeptide/dipeptide ABC transporter ATP-binding protein